MPKDRFIHVPGDYWTAHCVTCCEDINLKSADSLIVRRHFGHPLILSQEMVLEMFSTPLPFSLN